MWRDAALVAGKDLRIELRARVLLHQIAPFALVVLVLFGFALDADRAALRAFSAGLFWVTVLLSAILAVQRSAGVEMADGAHQTMRLAGLSPAGVFVGKATAILAELIGLELLLTLGILVLYDARVDQPALYAATAVVAAVGVAAAGTLYGALVAGSRLRETVLPILLLPVLAPVLIGATRAFEDALGSAAVDGWAWLGLLGGFAAIYVVFGALAYGALMEES